MSEKKPTIQDLEAILSRPHRGYFIRPDGSIVDHESENESLRSDLATLRSQLSEAREALDGLLKAFRSTTEYHRWGDDAEDFAFMERRGKFLGWEVFDPKGRVRGYIAAVRALSKLPSSKKQGGA